MARQTHADRLLRYHQRHPGASRQAARGHRPAEHLRRNEVARQRGFRSYAQERALGGIGAGDVRNRRDLDRLPELAQERRRQVYSLLSEARREAKRPDGLTLDELARRERVPVDVVRFYAREAVVQRNGRPAVTGADRLYRPVVVPSTDGREHAVDLRGSRVASDLGRYYEDGQHYLATGDPSRLLRWQGRRIGGVEVLADPDRFALLYDLGLIPAGPYGGLLDDAALSGAA